MYFVRRTDFCDSAAAGHQRAGVCACAISRPAARLTANARPLRRKSSAISSAKYHLDEPVWKQYLRYLGDLAHGDFGGLTQISQPHGQRHHRAGSAGLDDAGRAGVLLRDGCRIAGRILYRGRARTLGGLRRKFSGRARRVRPGVCRRAAVDSGLFHQTGMCYRSRSGIRRRT